jgi:cobalamin biosynthesis protein CbiG
MFSEEMTKRLIDEGIDPLTVKDISTINDKKKRKIITTITFNDDSKRKLVNDFIWYASRKNKRW